jgi:hypothetical protein
MPLPEDIDNKRLLANLEPRKQSAARRAGKWALAAGATVALLPAAFNLVDRSTTVQHEINMEKQAQQAQPSQAEINRAVALEEERAARDRQAVEMQDNTGTHVQ